MKSLYKKIISKYCRIYQFTSHSFVIILKSLLLEWTQLSNLSYNLGIFNIFNRHKTEA